MPYTITASQRGEPLHASRLQKASAAVLAMKWTEEGCTDVVILDEAGLRLSLKQFHSKHMPAWRGVWREPAT